MAQSADQQNEKQSVLRAKILFLGRAKSNVRTLVEKHFIESKDIKRADFDSHAAEKAAEMLEKQAAEAAAHAEAYRKALSELQKKEAKAEGSRIKLEELQMVERKLEKEQNEAELAELVEEAEERKRATTGSF